jgi:hypothetical protein
MRQSGTQASSSDKLPWKSALSCHPTTDRDPEVEARTADICCGRKNWVYANSQLADEG